MDLLKTGKFIQECRKAKKLTQVQLALKLSVSEKTISKWECGNGFPDTSLILPLCKELGISANELLCGKLLSGEEYKKVAEENLLGIKSQQEKNAKYLLLLEWVIGGLSVFFLIFTSFVSAYLIERDTWKIAIVCMGLFVTLVGVGFALKIEKDAGYYKCRNCGHKYIPTYSQVLWSMHMGRTRHMRCPKCGKRSWNKKTINCD